MITQGSAAAAGERFLPSLPDGADANGFSKCAWCWRGTSKQLLPGSPIEIERYGGPLFLSRGEKDDVWSVNRTKRLEKRLRDAGRRPEVHYHPEQTHRLTPEGRKVHQTRLVAFFRRYF